MSPEQLKRAERGAEVVMQAMALCTIVDVALCEAGSEIDGVELRYAVQGIREILDDAGDAIGPLSDELCQGQSGGLAAKQPRRGRAEKAVERAPRRRSA